MMPDLGRHAVESLSAYAVAVALLAALIAGSVLRARRTRARLDEVEARRGTPR